VAVGAGTVAAEAVNLPVGGNSSDPSGTVGSVVSTVSHTNLDPSDATKTLDVLPGKSCHRSGGGGATQVVCQANSAVAVAINSHHSSGDTWDRECGCWRHHHKSGGDDSDDAHHHDSSGGSGGGSGGGSPSTPLANTGTPIAGGLAGLILSCLSGGFLFWRRVHA
jgi:hypothetical protein